MLLLLNSMHWGLFLLNLSRPNPEIKEEQNCQKATKNSLPYHNLVTIMKVTSYPFGFCSSGKGEV